MVSHDHGSAVGHHTPSVSHQHPASGGLYIGLIVLQRIVLRQTPKWSIKIMISFLIDLPFNRVFYGKGFKLTIINKSLRHFKNLWG